MVKRSEIKSEGTMFHSSRDTTLSFFREEV